MSSIALMENIPYLAEIAEGFSLIAGLTLILFGIFGFKRYAEMRGMMGQQYSMAQPIMMIVCGSLLLALPSILPALISGVFTNRLDDAYNGPLPISDGMFMFIRFLGLCSVIRGIIMLSKTGGYNTQPGMRGKGLTHIFCGVLLLHITTVVNLVQQLFGA